MIQLSTTNTEKIMIRVYEFTIEGEQTRYVSASSRKSAINKIGVPAGKIIRIRCCVPENI